MKQKLETATERWHELIEAEKLCFTFEEAQKAIHETDKAYEEIQKIRDEIKGGTNLILDED